MVLDTLACVSNLWVRQMHFQYKGDKNSPHEHTYDHITLIAKGSFRISVNDVAKIFTAPHIVYIEKDKLHFIEALEDNSLACCLHALRTGVREADILEPSMTFSGPVLIDPTVTPMIIPGVREEDILAPSRTIKNPSSVSLISNVPKE
jgi:hypothetical protein